MSIFPRFNKGSLLSGVIALLAAGIVGCGTSATATPPPDTPTLVPTAAAAAPTDAPVVPTAVPTQAAPAQQSNAISGSVVPMQGVDNPSGWDPQRYGRAEDIGVNGLAYNQLVEYNPVSPSEIIGDLGRVYKPH